MIRSRAKIQPAIGPRGRVSHYETGTRESDEKGEVALEWAAAGGPPGERSQMARALKDGAREGRHYGTVMVVPSPLAVTEKVPVVLEV